MELGISVIFSLGRVDGVSNTALGWSVVIGSLVNVSVRDGFKLLDTEGESEGEELKS